MMKRNKSLEELNHPGSSMNSDVGDQHAYSQIDNPAKVLETKGDGSRYDPRDITINNQDESEGNLRSNEP